MRRVGKTVIQSDFCNQSPLTAVREGRTYLPSCCGWAGVGARFGTKTRDQLELERRSLSRIGDGYAMRLPRPRGVAVFDFRFRP